MISERIYDKWLEQVKMKITAKKIKKQDIAEKIGVCNQYISLLLKKKRKASEDLVEKISEYIGLDYEFFLKNLDIPDKYECPKLLLPYRNKLELLQESHIKEFGEILDYLLFKHKKCQFLNI